MRCFCRPHLAGSKGAAGSFVSNTQRKAEFYSFCLCLATVLVRARSLHRFRPGRPQLKAAKMAKDIAAGRERAEQVCAVCDGGPDLLAACCPLAAAHRLRQTATPPVFCSFSTLHVRRASTLRYTCPLTRLDSRRRLARTFPSCLRVPPCPPCSSSLAHVRTIHPQ